MTEFPSHADFPAHEAHYDPILLERPTRELLGLSQTNITPDPEMGQQYAAAAYDNAAVEFGSDPEKDPTAAAEAAAKGGLRAEQLGESEVKVNKWFDLSYNALRVAKANTIQNDTRIEREWVATYLLHGRTLALRATRSACPSQELVDDASWAFGFAEQKIARQHIGLGRAWDRYGTMLSAHRATHESRNDKTSRRAALGMAAVGAWRAVKARTENPSEKIPEEKWQRRAAHAQFVGKHVLLNAVAGGLAIARPRTRGTTYDNGHRWLARKILG